MLGVHWEGFWVPGNIWLAEVSQSSVSHWDTSSTERQFNQRAKTQDLRSLSRNIMKSSRYGSWTCRKSRMDRWAWSRQGAGSFRMVEFWRWKWIMCWAVGEVNQLQHLGVLPLCLWRVWLLLRPLRLHHIFLAFRKKLTLSKDTFRKKINSWCSSLTLLTSSKFLGWAGAMGHGATYESARIYRLQHFLLKEKPALWGNFFVLWFNSKTMQLVALTKKLFFSFRLFPLVVLYLLCFTLCSSPMPSVFLYTGSISLNHKLSV